ncbi:membrane-bound transcription factor site-2 protease-like [Dysidea avara]|uniref:membrane-bound transcription factor site-2 protease-like n=1 Tax=Dysidea avara TaxID=196820 RepID=UPI00332E0638
MLNFVGHVAVFWLLVYVVDKCMSLPVIARRVRAVYGAAKEAAGISISPCYIKLYTTRFNWLFAKAEGSRVARIWFGCGTLFGVLLFFSSVMLLCVALYKGSVGKDDEQVLTPVMPGLNLPTSDVPYYLTTLIVSALFHEAGHALAAACEMVRINGWGMFLLLVYPGAYVELHPDHLALISAQRQLRIYCAGVWHNLVLALCGLAVFFLLPTLLLPFYSRGTGAVVLYLPEDSIFSEQLSPSTVISDVNMCPVFSTDDWFNCVQKQAHAPLTGYCMPTAILKQYHLYSYADTAALQEGGRGCCPDGTQSDLCFHMLSNSPIMNMSTPYLCLAARAVVTRQLCSHPRDCKGPAACVFPSIPSSSRLIRIRHNSHNRDILYLGEARGLYSTVVLGDYNPRSSYVPLLLPIIISTQLLYLVSLSGAFALLNVVPAYALDGQWVTIALVEAWLEPCIKSQKQRTLFCNCVLFMGTFLLAANVIVSIINLVINNR